MGEGSVAEFGNPQVWVEQHVVVRILNTQYVTFKCMFEQ